MVLPAGTYTLTIPEDDNVPDDADGGLLITNTLGMGTAAPASAGPTPSTPRRSET